MPGAAIIAVGVNTDGRREGLEMETGTSETEPIWTERLRKLTRRALRGVMLVISGAQELPVGAAPRALATPETDDYQIQGLTL